MSHAFPELIRHGYMSCNICHVSPAGGGSLLSPYGRELSSAVLSTWGKEGEGQFLYGALPSSQYFAFGGSIRDLVLKQSVGSTSTTRFILMQADLSASAHYEDFTVVASGGLLDPQVYPNHRWISRQHYVMYQPSKEWAFRGGRFMHNFGINGEDHAIVTKQGLGWDQDTETYNVETVWNKKPMIAFITGVFSRPDIDPTSREKGLSTNFSYQFPGNERVGFSYFVGTSYTANRHVMGPYTILPFSKELFLLAEADVQRNYLRHTTAPEWGIVDYVRLGYMPRKGVQIFVTQQFSLLDVGDSDRRKQNYGAGVQFFPRPHFAVQAGWNTEQNRAVGADFGHSFYLFMHFYL
jgi:hypothetical protein